MAVVGERPRPLPLSLAAGILAPKHQVDCSRQHPGQADYTGVRIEGPFKDLHYRCSVDGVVDGSMWPSCVSGHGITVDSQYACVSAAFRNGLST